MQLESLIAQSHPDGNRVDISWKIPVASGINGVRVVRKRSTYPVSPDDGVMVSEADGLESVSDTDLQAGHTYYYMLFPYVGAPVNFELDTKNRVSALATTNHGYADYMYELLPAIYHRYDKNETQLKRFLQIAGGQLDQLHSVADSVQGLQNSNKVSGHLLPLLAQWIGWKTDHKFEFSRQREEIQYAPSIYKAVEIIPVVEATVKRVSGWESRSKEFVHNIFASNKCPRLNLWSKQRDNGGAWGEAKVLSLDYAFEGKPSLSNDHNNIRWLFYHTQRKDRWEIWYKTSPVYYLSLDYSDELVAGVVSNRLSQALDEAGVKLSLTASLSSGGDVWEISDGPQQYIIEAQDEYLDVYHITSDLGEMAQSLPIIPNTEANSIYKYPSSARQLNTLWLFWSVYNESSKQWTIQYRSRESGAWAEIETFIDSAGSRRYANAVVDQNDRLWLFWHEYNGHIWQLHYTLREPGGPWQVAVTMPLDNLSDPKVQADISVMMQPPNPDPRIYVFWSRLAPTSTPAQKRWEVVYRVKEDLVLDDANWTSVQTLPKDAGSDNHHDREAFPVLQAGGVEVFWSSNRGQSGWSIWRGLLSDYTTNTWDNAEWQLLTDPIYTQRNPLPVMINATLWLLHRSSGHMQYSSDVYRATTTYDERYAGSLTVDKRHTEKNNLRQAFEDVQCYTYDIGDQGERTNDDWIARDTIGIYLDNTSLSEDEVEKGINRLQPVMQEFMPMTDRAVFVANNELHTEYVYTYGLPASSASHYISSTYVDEFVSTAEESVLAEGEDFTDSLES